MKDLKSVSTEELISELESRPGVNKISVGQYQPYELKRKYYRERLSDEEVYVEAGEVLVIQNASVRNKEEHLPDEVEVIASEMAKTLNSLDNKIDEMKLGKEFEPYTGKLASLILQIPKLSAIYPESLNDREQQILNRFIELSGAVPSIRDLIAVKEMAAMDIVLEDIIQSLEICFSRYRPHYPSDKIRTFSYCKAFILHLLKQN